VNRRGFLAGLGAALAIDLAAPRRAYSFLWAPAPRRFIVTIGTGQVVELEEIAGRVHLAPGEPSLRVERTSFPGGGFEIGDEVSIQFAQAWAAPRDLEELEPNGSGCIVLPKGSRIEAIEP
jgi:hypothetical protein